VLEDRRLMSASGPVPARLEGVGWHALAERGHVPGDNNMPTFAAATEGMPPSELGKVAHDYVLANREALGLAPQSDFTVRKAFVGMDGLTHVRLDQTLGGVRVWGADVVAHLAPEDGHVLFVSGNVLADSELSNYEATISAEDAIGIGMSEYTVWAGGGRSPFSTSIDAGQTADAKMGTDPSLSFDRESSELVVYAGAGEPALTWHVEFFTEQQAGLDPGLWNFFVDAQSGEIVDSFDGLAHLSQASGPGGNPKVGDRPWVEVLDVEETGTPDLYTMDTARFVTTNMGNTTGSGTGTVVTGPLDPIGDAAINDAHGFTELTLDMLQDWFGYDSLDNAGFKVRSRVH
jgi:Zn-dependent metalloprotease